MPCICATGNAYKELCTTMSKLTDHCLRSYPIPCQTPVLRSQTPSATRSWNFVNAEDSIIVICDWDGTLAAPACTLLSEKGVQNAVRLHGGELSNPAKTPGTVRLGQLQRSACRAHFMLQAHLGLNSIEAAVLKSCLRDKLARAHQRTEWAAK